MRRFIYLVIAAGAVIIFGTSRASAQVINGCIKGNGTLKIVADPSDCTSRETPISWNQAGPQGEPGEPGPQGEPGDPEGALQQQLDALQAQTNRLPIVVDGAGEVLGHVLEVEGARAQGAIVQFDLPDLPLFPLRVLPQEIQGQSVTLWFESNDCTGQAWIAALLGTPEGAVTGTVFGITNAVTGIRTFYVADPLDSPGEMIFRLSKDTQGQGCEPAVDQVIAARVTPFDLDSMFTPPFRVTTRERM